MEKEYPQAAGFDKLNRDQDRSLFGLPPKSLAGADRTPLPASASLEGWRPGRLPDGSWGSIYSGTNPNAMPQDLDDVTITVRTRSGKSWHATVLFVGKRTE